MMRVVIDANVFVSAALKPHSKPAQIINLVKEGKIALVLSHDILEELKKVFRYPKIRKELRLTVSEIDEALAEIAPGAILTPGKIRMRAVKEDPEDNRYLECAVEGQADFIISGDHHLTDLHVFEGIKIVDPATFLRIMANR
jgi:putative PIN family toxin of toxin-antitoxin system